MVIYFFIETERNFFYEERDIYSVKSISLCHRANATACQMSHCFLFAISQVENNRAQAPERSNTGGVFHRVHLKCCWLDALSTATGLFVS